MFRILSPLIRCVDENYEIVQLIVLSMCRVRLSIWPRHTVAGIYVTMNNSFWWYAPWKAFEGLSNTETASELRVGGWITHSDTSSNDYSILS